MSYFQPLQSYVHQVIDAGDAISSGRKKLLNNAATIISNEIRAKDQVEAIFICTHNSRRSHLSQIWAQIAAWQYGIPLTCYSGGTEATAFYPSAVAALAAAGCKISREGEQNPCYSIEPSKGKVIKSFSKRFDDESNPQEEFIAFMTCSHADEHCPLVPGAKHRISLYYDDPKVFDGTDDEQEKYAERCFQIASEMYYMLKLTHEKTA